MASDDREGPPAPRVSERLSNPRVHHFQHEAGSEELATAVARAVAALEGVSPADLDARIGDVVDADALDGVFGWHSTGPSHGVDRLVFDFAGYAIAVYASGDVVVTEPPDYAGNN